MSKCIFYGYSPFGIHTNGNECPFAGGHSPCHMEVGEREPDSTQCRWKAEANEEKDKRISELASQLTALREERDRLREALKPFAEAWECSGLAEMSPEYYKKGTWSIDEEDMSHAYEVYNESADAMKEEG